MIPVRWLRRSLLNIESIYEFYLRENLASEAAKQISIIKRSVDQLQTFPELGKPGRVNGTRELIINRTPFIVIYRISEVSVEILRVLHCAQRWP
jgi:addiction module RelE/StbE family toxin